MMKMKQELLRNLPKVDEIIRDKRIETLMEKLPREKVVDIVRESINSLRTMILEEKITDETGSGYELAVSMSVREAESTIPGSLRPVINATGVVLHTNLGRASLSEKACERVMSVAGNYSTLEYDPEKGERGSRHSHVEGLIKKVTGAEAAVLVNNNAAATMVVLAALGKGREIIVSRGELVEIGGSFRIPDIMEESGAHLREVGTTNKTRIGDYEKAINENTGALLKVHTSNYRVIGFTEEASLSELRTLGEKYGLPVIYDMGSGLMTDLSRWGVREPVAGDGLRSGADLVLFSGDKLLGGPQAGIIAGKKDLVDRIRNHPLMRAFRADKMTFAAMEGTLEDYYDKETALENIPVLRMITESYDSLCDRALKLKVLIEDIPGSQFSASVIDTDGAVGGGSAPDAVLRSSACAVDCGNVSAETAERFLRSGAVPIVAIIRDGRVIFDVRTLKDEELYVIRDRMAELASAGEKQG